MGVEITRESAHDPRAIANKILQMREGAGQHLTMMQLIKLVYIADGWSLALLGKPLSKHNPQAWQYGPVYPVLYTALRKFGSQPVTSPVFVKGTDVPFSEEFTADEEKILQQVVDSYGKLSAFKLSNLTHQAGTPWSKAMEAGIYSDISAGEMAKHFEELRGKRPVKQ
jgi:uncharacterized phage-associated protein